MNRDDIIRMAREAVKDPDRSERSMWFFGMNGDQMFRFAALVAAAEREACAKVAEKMLRFYTQAVTGVPEAIRARGNT